MLGALTGDIIGSIYEFNNIKNTDFPLFSAGCRFTDDSVLTVALAEAIITNGCYETLMKEYYLRYPDCGYGQRFRAWARGDLTGPYNSYGNGAAMRISPVAWTCNSLDDVLKASRNYTVITHNHREGIKGAQATAAAIYLARTGVSKEEIRRYIEQDFSYDLPKTCDQIRPTYQFDESCQGTVPQAITAFLESRDFESSIRLRFPWAGTVIRWHVSPAVLPKPIMEGCRIGSPSRRWSCWMIHCVRL